MNRLALGAVAGVAAFLASNPVAQPIPRAHLAAARAKWASRDAPSYSYRVEYHAFVRPTPSTLVRVINGKPRATSSRPPAVRHRRGTVRAGRGSDHHRGISDDRLRPEHRRTDLLGRRPQRGGDRRRMVCAGHENPRAETLVADCASDWSLYRVAVEVARSGRDAAFEHWIWRCGRRSGDRRGEHDFGGGPTGRVAPCGGRAGSRVEPALRAWGYRRTIGEELGPTLAPPFGLP